MHVIYTAKAREDREYWEKNSNKIVTRIDTLLQDIQHHPFTGLGKPEPLKFQYSGYWSRRINLEHRLVYKVHDEIIYVVQCRFHY